MLRLSQLADLIDGILSGDPDIEITDAKITAHAGQHDITFVTCLLYTSPSPRDKRQSRMPSSA